MTGHPILFMAKKTKNSNIIIASEILDGPVYNKNEANMFKKTRIQLWFISMRN